MPVKPPVAKRTYNHKLPGFYGQFGSGAGVQAFYLQSVLSPAQLEWVSLISEIKGSERWPVRDLFQREVDNDRISMQNGLLDYLKNLRTVKFFNPITLTPLPMESNGSAVVSKMSPMVERIEKDEDYVWQVLERPNFHKVRWIKGSPEYATLEWCNTRTKLVAIDGQHRLSALKRLWQDQDSEAQRNFMTWNIPVVIVTFRSSEGHDEPTSVLEVVRSIFVNINSEARPVSRAREILLSDESVNAVCTQELVQLSHENDKLSREIRRANRLPLMVFDWRDEKEEKKKIGSISALKGIEEIFNWFNFYVLGEDFSDEQKSALDINPTSPFHEAFHDMRLTHALSDELRKCVRDDTIAALAYLLENFLPYKSYIHELRKLEDDFDSVSQTDISRHAFYELRFGTNHALESIKADVAKTVVEIRERIERIKRKTLCDLVAREIGMRGVMSAYGELRPRFGNPPWMDYTEWFVLALNAVYEDGWFDIKPGATRRPFLHHVAIDHSDMIVNYRFEDVSSALGAYLQLLLMSISRGVPQQRWSVNWRSLKEELVERLGRRVARGFRREVRPALRVEHPDGGKPLTEAVNNAADERAGRQLRRFHRALEEVEARGTAAQS